MAFTLTIFRIVLGVLSIFEGFKEVSCGGDSVFHRNKISAELQLSTSSDKIIRVGERLVLNCALVGTKNLSTYLFHLSWFYGTEQLKNATEKLSNGTVQLVIDHVSWSNKGTYACKETSENNTSIEPKYVQVKVGDIPSSPRNVWINNVEFETRIHWTSPSQSGQLPLHYIVKAQCKNKTQPIIPHCQSHYNTICDMSLEIKSLPGSNPLKWYCIARGGSLFQDVVVYDIFVEVGNALGWNQSNPVELKANLFDALETTPLPARNFFSKEMSLAGTVKLSWEISKEPPLFLVQYTILYNREGDSSNKTLLVHWPTHTYMIHDLPGFSLYHFYLMTQYGKRKNAKYGIFSQAAVSTLTTRISAPSQAPQITNCSKWSNYSSFSWLTVTWEAPPSKSLNGPLKNIILNSYCQTRTQSLEEAHNVTISNWTVHSVTIPTQQLSAKCHVTMAICNGPEFCSATSNACVMDSIEGSKPVTPNRARLFKRATSNHTLWIVISCAVGVLAGFALFVTILLYIRRRRNNRDTRPSLATVLEEVSSPSNLYDEIDEQPLSNSYDVIGT